MTRDEVIKALECCIVSKRDGACSRDCPRNNDPWPYRYRYACGAALMRDALALLKQDSADFVDGIQAMREICWAHVCEDCPAYGKTKSCGAQCAFFPDHDDLSPQEVAEIIWAYQAKKRKEEKADG